MDDAANVVFILCWSALCLVAGALIGQEYERHTQTRRRLDSEVWSLRAEMARLAPKEVGAEA